mmetsp:Transcript_18646/g.36269  ORF Transcript_18646/g.36269 Transcript_18646/m.36269 type:complete len:398 (+) Transcript_18646:55-1248(+)|eukprot:CAMPEP_0173384626 /NCGR_PEP_ID=MMETSP1356-20130122/7197_1 /TAXON_ID=77927 ORGANISM="Hemiselmis virescens, Strain PCC157" /NCGR_SAMPLE_ID=MMETSP1356 /ASSEMBLY_ACC=CAM_ASM_000847 /LENGTH=397 /DNA_ID=CAMNT_0014340077 /DNA_START=55 /DNA_END=1248 /DNA_ORIENTATION=-
MSGAGELSKMLASMTLAGESKSSKGFLKTLQGRVVPGLAGLLMELYEAQPADPHRWLAERMAAKNLKAAEFVEQHVLSLKQGDFFGEIALLSEKPRQASVRAKGRVTCMVISREAFTRLCGNLVEILRRNMDTYKKIEDLEGLSELEKDGSFKDGRTVSDDEPDVEPDPVPVAARRHSQRRSAVFVEPIIVEKDWEAPKIDKSDADKERLVSLLSKTALLGALDPSATNTVVDAMAMKVYKAGENVITQGNDGDYFYILDQGDADVFKTPPGGGAEAKVFEYTSGGSFGELALLHGEPRAATVRARGECKTWALDRDTFRKIMVTTGQRSMQNRTNFLDKVSLLAELQQFEKFKIAEAMEMRVFGDQDIILKEGDDGHEFYIIQDGFVECFKNVLKF